MFCAGHASTRTIEMVRWLMTAVFVAVACSGSHTMKHEQLELEMRQLRSLDAEAQLLQAVVAAHHSKSRYDGDRKSTRLNSSHLGISYAVFCLKKKKHKKQILKLTSRRKK